MHALEFVRNSGKQTLVPVYAMFGDDAFLKREAVGIVTRLALGPDPDETAVARFPGDQTALSDVLDEVRTLPFLSKYRIAIIEDADKFVTAHRAELEQYAAHPSHSGILILLVKLWNGTTKLAKVVAKTGMAVECKSPKESELASWLVAQAKAKHQAKLAPDAAALLVELVGPEVGILASEVEKLAVFVGTRAEIQREDVARMVGAGRVETIWQVPEDAGTGNGAGALEKLDTLVSAGEHPVGLLAAIGASLRKLHHSGELRRNGMSLNDACREAGITYPRAIELTRKQHAHLGPERVNRLADMLLQADLDMKGNSQLAPRVVLERFLMEMARPRKD
jgi:DNA polymerase-3 subunit delta